MNPRAESFGGGKSPERPPAKPPITEEAVMAHAKEMIKKMGLPVTSPDFEKAFTEKLIKNMEAEGQIVTRSK